MFQRYAIDAYGEQESEKKDGDADVVGNENGNSRENIGRPAASLSMCR